MYEYKVVDATKIKSRKPEDYEAFLNDVARDGWRWIPTQGQWTVWEREQK